MSSHLPSSDKKKKKKITKNLIISIMLKYYLPKRGAPLRVQETCGLGLPRSLPWKWASPPWANLALRNICSNTGGAASAGLQQHTQTFQSRKPCAGTVSWGGVAGGGMDVTAARKTKRMKKENLYFKTYNKMLSTIFNNNLLYC